MEEQQQEVVEKAEQEQPEEEQVLTADTDQQDTGEAPEEKQPEINQEAVNKRIGEITFQRKKAEKESEERQRRIDELEQRLQEKEKQSAPEVPPMPEDQYADDYELRIKQRDEAIKQRAEFDATQKIKANEELRAQHEAEVARETQLQAATDSFYARTHEFGIEKAKVDQSVETLVHDYGLQGEVGMHILKDQDGPLMATYLAANPMEADELSRMAPMQAAIYLETKVKPKAQKLKPAPSNAPDPPKQIKGSGVSESVHPLIKGAKFE